MMTQRDSFAVNSQPARACRKQPAGKSQSARARWQGRLQQKVIACQRKNNFGLPEDGTALAFSEVARCMARFSSASGDLFHGLKIGLKKQHFYCFGRS